MIANTHLDIKKKKKNNRASLAFEKILKIIAKDTTTILNEIRKHRIKINAR